MRLAVLSDIHGNLLALEAVLNDLAEGADKIWVLGDLCAFGPRPAECIQRVRDLKGAEVISGNTDRYAITGARPPFHAKDEAEWQKFPGEVREREARLDWTVSRLSFQDYEYLSKLHHELGLDVPGYGHVIGYHGSPGSDEHIMLPDTPADEVLDQFLDREGRLGFGGHTHIQMDRDLGRWRVVNGGSIGLPMKTPRACYALVTFDQGAANVDLRQVDYDRQAVLADMRQQANPGLAWWEARMQA